MNLQNLREKAKLTRVQLATILKCHKQQIYNFEKGVSAIPIKYAPRLAKALKISQKDLIKEIVNDKVEKLMKELK